VHDAVLLERGKAVVASGKHAPPPPQWTAEECRYWFGHPGGGDVVDLDEYRRFKAAPK
jgi:hypothetical protein